MPKQPATVDDNREPDNLARPEIQSAIEAQEPPELASLVLSGIVTHSDGMVTWRDGHLEHIANQYKGDPQTTERNYQDDLAIARRYSADEWERLINGS